MAKEPSMPEKDDFRVEFAFVVYEKQPAPTEEMVRSALAKHLPKKTKIANIEIDEKGVSFDVDGNAVVIGYMPAPIPWEDLEGPCAVSWLWKDATKTMKAHKRHAIVILMNSPGEKLDRCLLLTKIVAGATKFLNATGVYWGHGSVVLPSDTWRELADDGSADDPPLMAWIEFRIQHPAEGRTNVLTTGLAHFDCMEVEITNSANATEDVLNLAMGVAHITIRGEKIPDGDTVGPDGDTKIKVHHAKSIWDRPEKVLNLDY